MVIKSDWPDLPGILGNQNVCLTAGDGVDWQLNRWHNKAFADWQPQPLAQTVERSVSAWSQDKNVSRIAVTWPQFVLHTSAHWSVRTHTNKQK